MKEATENTNNNNYNNYNDNEDFKDINKFEFQDSEDFEFEDDSSPGITDHQQKNKNIDFNARITKGNSNNFSNQMMGSNGNGNGNGNGNSNIIVEEENVDKEFYDNNYWSGGCFKSKEMDSKSIDSLFK